MNLTKRKYFIFLMAAAMIMFFALLYYSDNKYQTPPPYGKNGVIELKESDFSRNQPLFLIDGWLLSDEYATNQPTYIGEFSTLQRGSFSVSPHGTASYCLTLRYSGNPLEVAISFPQLFNSHSVSLNGQTLSQGNGSAKISFTLTSGDHLLTVETLSRQGYYSGMYYPPALAATDLFFSSVLIQCIAYCFAFFAPLVLAIFTMVLWRSTKDMVVFWFGLLCFSFSFYVSYYFVRLLSLPLVSYWYLLQSAAFYFLCFCVIRLMSLIGGGKNKKLTLWVERISILSSAVLFVLALLIPSFTWVLQLHGILTNLYYLFTFCSVVLLCYQSKHQTGWEHLFTQLACTAFGMGLLLNLFFSNRFEPILFFWQFEWCGLFLVLLFGAMMIARNKRLLTENEAFSNHLEMLVEKRTEELSKLLQERKAFFAEISHDLKAPVFATKTFIQAIRQNNTGVDGELLHYIDEVERKHQEITRRVQGLNVFNKMDAITQPKELVSVCALLDNVYKEHHMSAEVASVHFIVEPSDTDCFLFAQPEKLSILFENLIFNALRHTPPEGSITLAAEPDGDFCHISFSDTGSGIPYEDLPHIFERFYVGKENKGNGTGLGLFIVKNIVEELGGEITLSSKLGQGTTFYIELPVIFR